VVKSATAVYGRYVPFSASRDNKGMDAVIPMGQGRASMEELTESDLKKQRGC
jgi:hypothetical protein